MTPDAAFGYRREGTPATLAALGLELGFDVVVVPPFTIDGRSVRSTEVRSAIAAGDLDGAAALLGRPHTVIGVASRDEEGSEDAVVAFPLPVMLPPDGRWPAVLDTGAREHHVEVLVEGGRLVVPPVRRSRVRVRFGGWCPSGTAASAPLASGTLGGSGTALEDTMDGLRWGVLSSARIATEKVIPGMRRAEPRGGRRHRVARCRRPRRRSHAELGIPVAHGSYEALLEDPAVDAVYIPLPNHLHAEWTISGPGGGQARAVREAASRSPSPTPSGWSRPRTATGACWWRPSCTATTRPGAW